MLKKLLKSKLVLSGIVVLLLSGALAVKRLSVYGYDVRQDYLYNLPSSQGVTVQGRVAGGKLSFDSPLASYDTVLIELSVDSTWIGLIREPVLIIGQGGKSVTQALEMGAKGRRYFNISSLLPATSTDVFTLQTTALEIPDQQVRAYCFSNDIDRGQRILVISPHPDDAEIAAFGLYASHPEATIVTVTAGDAGRNKYDEVYDQRGQQALKKGELRVWNSITVPLLGGVPPERAVNLGYFDSTLQQMAATPQRPVTPKYADLTDTGYFRRLNVSALLEGRPDNATWQNLVGDLEQIIAATQPDIFVTPYPRIDSHLDHKYATFALLQALENLGRRSGQLLLYTNHCSQSDYVPYGPMYSSVTLPPAFDNRLYFERVYSLTLPPSQQRDKYFALEAMNDLRLDTEWMSVSGTLKYLFKVGKNVLFNEDFSYFRRSVRAEEMFFVIDLSSLDRADFKALISD